jgi:hypothetical protein
MKKGFMKIESPKSSLSFPFSFARRSFGLNIEWRGGWVLNEELARHKVDDAR